MNKGLNWGHVPSSVTAVWQNNELQVLFNWQGWFTTNKWNCVLNFLNFFKHQYSDKHKSSCHHIVNKKNNDYLQQRSATDDIYSTWWNSRNQSHIPTSDEHSVCEIANQRNGPEVCSRKKPHTCPFLHCSKITMFISFPWCQVSGASACFCPGSTDPLCPLWCWFFRSDRFELRFRHQGPWPVLWASTFRPTSCLKDRMALLNALLLFLTKPIHRQRGALGAGASSFDGQTWFSKFIEILLWYLTKMRHRQNEQARGQRRETTSHATQP